MSIRSLARSLHNQLHEAVDEVAKAEKALARIVTKYSKLERTDPDKPPPIAGPGVSWAVGDGRLQLVKNQAVQDGMFSRAVVIGVRIGSRFAVPQGVESAEARKERYALLEKIREDVRKILAPLTKTNGGFIVDAPGSAYSVIGWVQK